VWGLTSTTTDVCEGPRSITFTDVWGFELLKSHYNFNFMPKG